MSPGELLRRVRVEKGLTQRQLAERAGTSQPVISAYEHDRRDPTFCTLHRLLAAAGVQLRLDARPQPEIDPPADEKEHARRLLDVLSLVDAIPLRPRPTVLDAPRIVSSRP
jgi:transcriptional regulator with XRE-family HTH domain